MKRTPLKRKTPLRAAGPGKIQRKEDGSGGPPPGSATRKDKPRRLSKPIKLIGKRGKRLAPVRSRSEREVRRRAGGICELFENGQRCEAEGSDWSHLFGRGNIVPEPMASAPQLTRLACRPHHERWHSAGAFDLIEENRWVALLAMADEIDFPRSQLLLWLNDGWTGKQGILTMLRQLAEREAA